MTEHPTKQELDEYCRRVLRPDAFLSVHRHINACPRCATQCNSPEDLPRDLDALHASLLSEQDDTPYHLSATEVAAYVRGTLDEIDLEITESHLGTCSTCLSEVQRHKAEVEPIVPVAKESISLPLIQRWQSWRVAAVASFGVILILLTVWMLRIKPGPLQQQANLSSPRSSPTASVQASPTPNQAVFDNAQLALVLNDGNAKVTIDQRGTLTGLERLPSRIQHEIRSALQTGKLEQSPSLAQLASRSSVLLSRSGNGLPFGLIGPLGQVVNTERPTFRWRQLTGAQSYTVTVTDGDLNVVATSPPLNTTEWRITNSLKDGEIYSWQVTALKDGATITSPVLPAPQAKFKVLDRSTSETLQQAKRAYPESHLTLGVLYAQAGLLDDAERELRVLVRDNPDSRIGLKLLQNVKAMRATQTSRR
jgi:anti-sigma factor RsiW